MRESDFESFLTSDVNIKSSRGVQSRLSHARSAEKILGTSLDMVVSDDDKMYEAMVELRKHENPIRAQKQNAVRKYYIFCNGKEFPKTKNYHSAKHP